MSNVRQSDRIDAGSEPRSALIRIGLIMSVLLAERAAFWAPARRIERRIDRSKCRDARLSLYITNGPTQGSSNCR